MSSTVKPPPTTQGEGRPGGSQGGFSTQRRTPTGLLIALGIVALALGGLFILVTPVNDVWTFVIITGLVLAVLYGIAAFAFEGGRKGKDRLVTTLVWVSFAVAFTPLALVLGYTIWKGLERFDLEFFTTTMRNVRPTQDGGGALHAIVGTIEQVMIAAAISVPLGILTAIYLVEYGKGRLATTIRFFTDVMTGVPSIVAGLFIYAAFVLGLGIGFSGFAASLALTILMLPTVVRSTEEMLKLVPDTLREASYALGVPKYRTILRIVLPTALTGIVTGVMLAIARIAGETAPLLLTSFGNPNMNANPFDGPQESLPMFVYFQATNPQTTAVARAWTGALVLIILVMSLNIVARWLASRNDLMKTG
jgi:phosphate transport system permease protein